MIVIVEMVLLALVIGTVTAVLGTGRVTIPLVASTTVVWCWIPLLQLLTGLLFIRGTRLPLSQALARYFQTGRYWSCWLLLFAGAVLLAPQPFTVLNLLKATALIPLLLTARALVEAGMDICGDTRPAARRRVVMHQALTYAVFLVYFGWAVALGPRIASLVRA